MAERRYTTTDFLRLKRDVLVSLVQRQPDKWPASMKKFNAQKTNKNDLKDALINGEFTTTDILEHPATPPLNISIPPPNSSLAHITESLDPRPSPIHHEGEEQLQRLSGAQSSFATDPLPEAATAERRSIVLLVEDIRPLLSERVSQRVAVSVINPDDSGGCEWQASSLEIVDALQASISAFKGPARIGTQDPQNREYTMFFATIPGAEDIENDSAPSPMLLDIPQTGTLKLTVSHIQGRAVSAKRPRSESLTDHAAELLVWAKASGEPKDSSASTIVKKKRPTPLTPQELAWLTEKAKTSPGFDIFNANHNRRLNNSDRVKYWKFAATFCAKYYKTQWPVGLAQSNGITIRRAAIEEVLGIATTSMAQAINMDRILSIHYDGAHKSEEVARMIDATEDISGSDSLAKFLSDWEKEHPVSPSA
ncbi:hypothetical protein DFH09DRAFT_1344109 [Mycena vulgaris]|nr:hypothetical protein DFH09DRAFT_1344109 [Mycena vulgaris]